MSRILLFDGDIIAYRAAFSCQEAVNVKGDVWEYRTSEKDLRTKMSEFIDYYVETYKPDSYRVALTGGRNFRHTVLPTYKENRKAQMKPVGLVPARRILMDEYNGVIEDGIEADDLLSLWATKPTDEERIIVSVDKDFKSTPCLFIDPNNPEDRIQIIDEATADFNLFCQTLAGDTTDNYHGIKGVGMKGAAKILTGIETTQWDAVKEAYRKAGLSLQDALMNARCARLLRHGEYSFETKEVTLYED